MKRMFFMVAWLLVTATTSSQPADTSAGATAPLDIEVERTHIQTERARESLRYEQEEAACYARFAVTDCLRQARTHRREVLDRFRRQEVILNDAERKRKAQEQIQRIREKSSIPQ